MFKSVVNLLSNTQWIVAASNVRVSNFGCPFKFFKLPQKATSIIRSFCDSANSKCGQQQFLTVSYLINSCGLSPEAAAVASKKVMLKSPENADSVLRIFKSYGLSDAHIIELVTKLPTILCAYPEKTILPKLKFFHSIGMPATVLAGMICVNPYILRFSLHKSIIPFYDHMKNLLQNDKKIITVFRRLGTYYFRTSLRRIPSNANILRNYGVSELNISYLVVYSPKPLLMKSDELIKLIERVSELGIDTSKSVFVLAVEVLSNMSRAAWERREEAYRKWGWSDSDIHRAFLAQPICMRISEKKIMAVMEFLVNEMNCQPKDIARCPYILLLSLENRIAPRCRVMKLLKAKGLMKKSYGIYTFTRMTEKEFLERFVKKYDNVSELLDAYHR